MKKLLLFDLYLLNYERVMIYNIIHLCIYIICIYIYIDLLSFYYF